MIVQCHSIAVLTIAFTFWAHLGSAKGERWSRQVLNSEWIPLANPRSLQSGGAPLPGIVTNPGVGNQPQLQPLALPAELRDQYHQQLLQLQETQESIQKLLQLQQQLRAQQQLLQSQSYLPEGFSTEAERKSALHQSTIANIRTLPQLAPGALIPPIPGDQPQLPQFAAQDFVSANQQKISRNEQIPQNQQATTYNVNSGEEQKSGKNEENLPTEGLKKTKAYATQQGGHYKQSKQSWGNQNGQQFVAQTTPGLLDDQNDDEEEVQLLYVPAETLAQRDQQQRTQRVRNRKQHSTQEKPQRQQQQNHEQQQLTRQGGRYQQQQTSQQDDGFQSQGLEGTRPSAAQQTFANQVLYQLQQEQAKRTRIQQEEREKEEARLQEEQIELERQAKLHQELVFREQDQRRQRELALRKELERQEEEARQKELQRLKELNQRNKQDEAARKMELERQEELERQKVEEIREQERKQKEAESRQAEIDRLAALEREKELEIQRSIEQQQELEKQQAEEETKARAQFEAQRQAQARAQLEAHHKAHQETIEKQRQAQIDAAALDARNRARNQAQQQYLTETTRPKSLRLKGRQRQRNRQENQPPTPSANQPPLSVYMGTTSPITNAEDLKVSDVLTILKDAKTISVLDSVGPDTPQVFVGPTNLAPPTGYAKFDLPYLSAIDNNRVERKVDKLPFFVAPLSFKPPPGYSKIPFPAPHIGSVVVNTLDNEPDELDDPPGGILRANEQLQPNPTPLIEPNSYVENAQLPTGDPYVQHVTPEYSQEALVATTTPKYEASSYSSTPSSGTRYRHRQFYSDRAPHVFSTATHEGHPSTEPGSVTRTKFRQLYKEEQGHETPNYKDGPKPSPQPIYQENIGPRDNLQQNFAVQNGEQEFGQHGDVTERYNAQSVPDEQLVKNAFHDSNQAHVASEIYNPAGSNQGLRFEFGTSQTGGNQYVHGREDSRLTSGPTQYTIGSELPRISPQLPGLVNSLTEGQEPIEKTLEPSTTTTTTTSTTTTTTAPPTTTHRSRGRQRGRIVPTRAPTTKESSPTRSPAIDRSRRPYSRSRVRQGYGSTTETYQETIYDPTKSKFSGTQEKTDYSATIESQRKPAPRNQRYRGRGSDRNAVQPEARPDAGLTEPEHNPPSHETSYADNPVRHSLQEPSAPVQNLNAPIYHENVFPSSGNPSASEDDKLKTNTQNVQPAVAEAVVTREGQNSALRHDAQQTQGVDYHTGLKTSSFGQSNVEQNPINGFNYQTQNDKFENVPEATISPQQYPVNNFDGQRPEQIYGFHGDQVVDSPKNFQNVNLNRDSIYGSDPSAKLPSLTDLDNPKPVNPGQNNDERPVFDHHLSDQKDDLHHMRSTTTEAPEEMTTPRPTLTPAPLAGRQRTRGRLNQNSQRVHVDSVIQTRPTGSRDEFVRFSAVNQDTVRPHSTSGRTQPGGNRQRLRNRGQVNQANIQTEGNDYVRIQSPPLRPVTTTTTSTTTETPLNYPKGTGEEIEYGFIRPPSFKPIYPAVDRPIANAVPTYRPKYEQVQTEEPSNDAPVEVNTPSQSQGLKNRQKYQLPSRRPLTRSTTVSPPLTTASTETYVENVYTSRPKPQNDEYKGNRIRGRVRRPGKKRTTTTSTTTTTTTTTTESILDSNNELPLDENYPQIIQGVPAAPLDSSTQRRTLFDEELKSPNLETLPQAVALQKPAQLHSFEHQENPHFPRQDFVLNFGIGPEHDEAQDEYDQTQLASSHHRQYNDINRGHSQPQPASLSVADIEGAESQWSTKLTHSSFQPISLLNHVHTGVKNNERREKSEDSFDIITAGPDLASADRSATANNDNAPRDIVVNASYLGNTKRGGSEVHGNRETPLLQSRSIVETKNKTLIGGSSGSDSLRFWNNGYGQRDVQGNSNPSSHADDRAATNRAESNDITMTPKISQEALSETTTEFPKTESDITPTAVPEIIEEPTTKKRTIHRRRRVRIRVRPTTDDFVSAESQHVSSAWNFLVRDKQSYGNTVSFNELKTTTSMPRTSSTTEESTTEKSFLKELLEEMTKESEREIPVAAAMPTTNVPENTEPTNDSFTKISEETETRETPEFPTTQKITTTAARTDSTIVDSPTTTIDHTTTLTNEQFVTEATTEHHKFSLNSHEEKKSKPTEPVPERRNRFQSEHRQKNWWNHNYDAVTQTPESTREEEAGTFSPEHVTELQESTSQATTIANIEEPESPSEHSLSDYVDAFFKTMGGEEEQDGEKLKESDATLDSSSASSDFEMEENKETKTTLPAMVKDEEDNVLGSVESTTVYGIEEVPGEQKVINEEDALTTKKIEEVSTTPGQEASTSVAPITTSEVPFSPEELTTEIPATTTTVSPSTTKTNTSINQLGKVLRTSTTTEISHMTEICYRGRCVKTKSRKEIRRR